MTFMPSTCSLIFQSTPPHGERRRYRHRGAWYLRISIHAPRMGSDMGPERRVVKEWLFQSTPPAWGATRLLASNRVTRIFQSTPPAWGATYRRIHKYTGILISIHAPRMGSDMTSPIWQAIESDFNPRPPHGERPEGLPFQAGSKHFNPRPPHGERHL